MLADGAAGFGPMRAHRPRLGPAVNECDGFALVPGLDGELELAACLGCEGCT